jgi:hypothetical protein
MDQCPTCTHSKYNPFRRNDENGQIIYGCIDAFHSGHLMPNSNTSTWHERPFAKKHRAAIKKHLAELTRKRRAICPA